MTYPVLKHSGYQIRKQRRLLQRRVSQRQVSQRRVFWHRRLYCGHRRPALRWDGELRCLHLVMNPSSKCGPGCFSLQLLLGPPTVAKQASDLLKIPDSCAGLAPLLPRNLDQGTVERRHGGQADRVLLFSDTGNRSNSTILGSAC